MKNEFYEKGLTKENLKAYTEHFLDWLKVEKSYRTYYGVKLKEAHGAYKEKMIINLHIENDKVVIWTENYRFKKTLNDFWNSIEPLFDINEYRKTILN
jgi:hypothetical protein